MDIRLVEMWATPSVLHLRVAIEGKGQKWVTFKWLDIPLDALVDEVSEVCAKLAERASSRDQPLF